MSPDGKKPSAKKKATSDQAKPRLCYLPGCRRPVAREAEWPICSEHLREIRANG